MSPAWDGRTTEHGLSARFAGWGLIQVYVKWYKTNNKYNFFRKKSQLVQIESYVQDGETVYCDTIAKKGVAENTGALAVTDSRLIFIRNLLLSDNRVLDIDLNRIEEVEYLSNPINYKYLAFGSIMMTVAAIAWLAFPEFSALPNDQRFITTLGSIGFGVAMIIDAIYPRSPTLIIRTPSGEHTFEGGEFEKFPHAIRGGGG